MRTIFRAVSVVENVVTLGFMAILVYVTMNNNVVTDLIVAMFRGN